MGSDRFQHHHKSHNKHGRRRRPAWTGHGGRRSLPRCCICWVEPRVVERDRGVWRGLSRVDPGSLGPDPPQSPVRRAGAAGVEWSSPAALQTPAIPHSTFSSRVGSSTSHHPTSPLDVQMQRHRRLDPRTRRITYHPGFNPSFFLLFPTCQYTPKATPASDHRAVLFMLSPHQQCLGLVLQDQLSNAFTNNP